MQVVVLACQQQVAHLRHHRQLRERDIVAVLAETTDRALLHTIEIANGQGRRGIHVLDSLAEARMHLLDHRQQFFRTCPFPLFILIATTTNGRVLPLSHHIKRHGCRHQHLVRPRSLILLWWCHHQESHRPRRSVATEVPDIAIARHKILRVVDIGETVLLHPDIEREGGITVGYLVHTVAERLGEGTLVHQRQQRTGVDIRYIPVGLVLTTLARSHVIHLAVVHLQPLYAIVCHHLTTVLLDHIGQEVGKTAAATHKPTGTVDIKHTDHSMHKGWRLPFPTTIERIHIGHHTAQFGVVDIFGDKLVGCHEEVVRVTEEVGACRTEIEQVEFLGQGIKGLDIALQILTLLRERLGQRVDKGLLAFGDGIILLVLREVQFVCTVVIHIAQVHFILNTQITADAPDITTWSHATHDVHTCIKRLTKAGECLQSATDGSVFLQHSHVQALLRQDGSTKQST